jgi:hypothetical protein
MKDTCGLSWLNLSQNREGSFLLYDDTLHGVAPLPMTQPYRVLDPGVLRW